MVAKVPHPLSINLHAARSLSLLEAQYTLESLCRKNDENVEYFSAEAWKHHAYVHQDEYIEETVLQYH